MDIGRLEFYATKRDRRGNYFGKIFPFSLSLRMSLDDGLVFFHESCIPSTSSLRTSRKFQGYRHAIRFHGRTDYASPVYVAFDMPQDSPSRRGDAASTVMLLDEADPEEMPDLVTVTDAGVRVALISAFPSVYTLSRIGLEVLRIDSRLEQLRACWDGSEEDDKAEFVRSLDSEDLKRAMIRLIEIDRRDDQSLASPDRTRLAFAVRPDAVLLPDIATELTPSMWVDEFLTIMKEPDDRRALMSSCMPLFRVYALAMLAEQGGALEESVADDFVAAFYESKGTGIAVECLRRVLSAHPRLALRGDVSAMLTPTLWVNELVDFVRSPEERQVLLAHAQPAFCTYSLAKLTEMGEPLDSDAARVFIGSIREYSDVKLVGKCVRLVLSNQPSLALVDDMSAMLSPNMWVDEMLTLMGHPEERHSFLAATRPEFHAYAIERFVMAGERLDDVDISGFAVAIRECEDANLVAECLAVVLAKEPQIALMADVASRLTRNMWMDELLDYLGTRQGQMALLGPSRPDFKAHAVQKLIETGVDLDVEILALCPLRSCPALLNQVQWSSDDASYAEVVGRWLREACLCDAEGRRLIVSAAEQMHDTGGLLSPTMWVHLPVAMRIRLCVFWSNHYSDLDDYVVRGGVTKICIDAYRSSWEGYSQALKAALLLLALPLSKNVMKAFLDANDALIGEIVRQFNECDADALRSFELGDDLQAMLQRCASLPYVYDHSVRGFCDGRWWEGASAVWCHAGVDRPGGGRRKCDVLRPSAGCTSMKCLERSVPECQFMADFLANVSDAMGGSVNVGPWLNSRDALDLVEYAYRVSGYVNKMAAALPHMVCRGCGARLRLNYEYPRKGIYGEALHRGLSLPALSATLCSCPNLSDGYSHDADIYIHYCLNCHRIIDSRECRMRDRDGYYLCMYCGASKVYGPATACPSCGNTDLRTLGYYTGSLAEELSCLTAKPRAGEVLITCKAKGCKYDAREFESEFEDAF